MRGIGRVKRWGTYYATKALKRTIILLYHRIAELPSDPQKLCVTPKNFNEHLSVIRHKFLPISLDKASRNLKDGRVTSGGVVITFDDGYADNLYHAKPILEKHDVPATVFVVSDWINSQREFFWDDFGRIFLSTIDLPDVLEIEIGRKKNVWNFTNSFRIDSAKMTAASSDSWNVESANDPTTRHTAYREFCSIVRNLNASKREDIVVAIANWSGVGRDGRPNHRTLTEAELTKLCNGGLIQVGSHTKSHVRLSQLSEKDQGIEILESKNSLEELLGHSVQSFSYPYGSRADYNYTSVTLAQKAGYVCAVSNFSGHVHRFSSLYQLPRFIVRDWDGDEFERRLSQWW